MHGTRFGRTTGLVAVLSIASALGAGSGPNDPGILEPALTATLGTPVRIPHTDQADGSSLLNVVGAITVTDAHESTSITGHPITRVQGRHDDLARGLRDLTGPADLNRDGTVNVFDLLIELANWG